MAKWQNALSDTQKPPVPNHRLKAVLFLDNSISDFSRSRMQFVPCPPELRVEFVVPLFNPRTINKHTITLLPKSELLNPELSILNSEI
jgi:hypothetical protein